MSRIALLLPELEAGGAQRVMLLLAREFMAAGHEVELLVLDPRGPLRDEIPTGLRLTPLSETTPLGLLWLALQSTARLSRWLRRERPDALLSTITGTNLVAALAHVLAGRRSRLVLREAVTLGNVRNPLRLQAMRLLYARADAIVALSSAMASQLQARLGLPRDRLHCIGNPCDTARITRLAAAALDHPAADASRRPVILSVGRLIQQKDHRTLLHAFAALGPDHPARLVIVGEGPLRPELEALARQLGIAERFSLPGFDANPWRWMARADLFVLSSLWEGHPNALCEALALGLPAVITEYDASAHDFARSHGVTVVPAAQAQALGSAIAAALARQPSDTAHDNGDLPAAADAYLSVLLGKLTEQSRSL